MRVRRWATWAGLAGAVWLAACGAPGPGTRSDDAPAPAVARPEPAPPATAAPTSSASRRPRIVFLGDSLTAGLGLPPEQSFPTLIQERLDAAGLAFEVVNAGVSGDTSAGGLRRLDWALEGSPKIVVVALGGNDGLRGVPPADLKRNLTAIITRSRQAGAEAILAGMEAPPNNGPEYTAEFRRVYADVARAEGVVLIPFLLEGVAGESALNQADGIHPNRAGAARVADVVWAVLEPLAARTAAATR